MYYKHLFITFILLLILDYSAIYTNYIEIGYS